MIYCWPPTRNKMRVIKLYKLPTITRLEEYFVLIVLTLNCSVFKMEDAILYGLEKLNFTELHPNERNISFCHLLLSVHLKQEQPDLCLQCWTSKTFQQTTKTCDWRFKSANHDSSRPYIFVTSFLIFGKNKIRYFICFV